MLTNGKFNNGKVLMLLAKGKLKGDLKVYVGRIIVPDGRILLRRKKVAQLTTGIINFAP